MEIQSVKIKLLFETSWEVCNKVGGIYTVLSTKAKSLHDIYKDNLIFIGPDVWSEDNPSPFFVESKSLLKGWRLKADLPEGVSVRVGRWNIPGKPLVVLVSFDSLYSFKDQLYGEMWSRYGVDSLHAYGDYDEACAFSHASALVIESISKYSGVENGEGVVAHFNEWTTGMGLLHVKWKMPQAATVFTTHATSIGRSICGNGKPLYDYLSGYNGDQMASELNMQSKHSLEKAAAHQADCFTTVSSVTATECAQLLEKVPDVVTPNGFEPRFVPSKTKMPVIRKAARAKLLSVASALTGKTFSDNTIVIATSGRCEYRNKGIDLFLDSINELRAAACNKDILAFILVPAWSREGRTDLKHLLETPDISNNNSLPDPVITHYLNNPDSDSIIKRIHALNFNNVPVDNISVVYVPCYLNGDDGIFNMAYYDVLPGLDVTVFPSYYEPWGYTPLESIAFGVPTVTTTLSGFGQWVLSYVGDSIENTGVDVATRNDGNYTEVCNHIAVTLTNIVQGQYDMKNLSNAARHTSSLADWSHFIGLYLQAFEIAICNSLERNKNSF